MASDIGTSLVKIQDDLSKLRHAIQNGTHSDGTPIDIHAIESVVERTQLRVSRAIEKAARDKNTQVHTLPFLRPSRSLSPERIQALLKDSVSQSNGRSRISAHSPRPPGKLEPIKTQDFDAVSYKKFAENRKGKPVKSRSADRRHSPSKLNKLDVDKGLLSLCERGLIPPGSRISLRNTPVRPKQLILHPSTEQHTRPLIADVDQSAGQLALVKLAPEFPHTAVQVKLNLNESTHFRQEQQVFLKYGTKERVSSSPPYKPGTKGNTPTENRSREIIQSDNLQLIYEFSSSLNKPLEQIESQQSYFRFKSAHSENWGPIVSLLRHLVSSFMKLGVSYATIQTSKLAQLALEYTLEILPPVSVLLECVEDKEEVVSEMKRIGQGYKAPGGIHRAATRIQATWRMFLERRRYLQARRLKWAAGVICMSWILRMRMVGIRKILTNKRAGFVERAKNRNIQLGRCWSDFEDSPHTIVHLPSLGCHSSIRAGIRNLELRQSSQIARLFDLSSNSNTHIVYISPIELREELLEYYFDVLSQNGTDTNKARFQSIVPNHMADFEYNKLSLATVLTHSPRSLRRIKHLIQGRNTYLTTDIPSVDDFAIADYLNVPILAAYPEKMDLFQNKSDCQRIMDTTGVQTPPHATDIWTQNALIAKFADLVILNLDHTKWVFKMNHGIEAMGTAHCDIRQLSCYEVLKRDRMRYRDNWEQRWAHESSHSKLILEIPMFLLKHLKIADTALHSSANEFLQNFFRYGGLIQAMPSVDNYTTLTINLFIAPNGTVKLVSSGDQIISSPFKVWGISLPQTSINPTHLHDTIQKISDTILTHEIIGHVSFDLVTFLEGDNQTIWLTDIKLSPSPYMGLIKMLNSTCNGHFDTITGHYLSEIDGRSVPKFAVISNNLKHSNFSLIRYKVLFQMFKAQGIVYRYDTRTGTMFGLIDDVNRRQIGMVVQSNSLQEALETTYKNMSVIHQEISSVAMQGRNNFDDVINQVRSILHKISN